PTRVLHVEVDGCSKMNSPLGVERLLQEGISKGNRGEGRRKETKRISRWVMVVKVEENEKDKYEDH
ncbi:hypothetical protein, partial [Bifidobacterium breve]